MQGLTGGGAIGIVLVCLLAYVPLEVTLNGKPAVLQAEVVGDAEHVVEVDGIFLYVGDGRGLVLRTEEGRVYLGNRLAGVFAGADDDAGPLTLGRPAPMISLGD